VALNNNQLKTAAENAATKLAAEATVAMVMDLTSVAATTTGAWLGIPIFGSDFWDPHRKRNSNSVFDSKDSGRIFFEFRC
jgi:hypothetical protein